MKAEGRHRDIVFLKAVFVDVGGIYIILVYGYPQAVSVGPLEPQFPGFLKFSHSAPYRSQGNTGFCANIFLRYLRIVLDYLHNCLVVDIRLLFGIGVIGANFGTNGAGCFRINDTILIDSCVFSIKIEKNFSCIRKFFVICLKRYKRKGGGLMSSIC